MAQPGAFKLRQAENRPNHYTGDLPEIDRKRATAVLLCLLPAASGISIPFFYVWSQERLVWAYMI